ncbi:hypothetical protein ACIPLC_29230 [Kitasatospora sp. NPDC086801]|uniref:hypothetical protein n=1 Tax=Kitasatospora sp. NPDC086801 TaxID=3364066 RepID=UPI003825CC04
MLALERGCCPDPEPPGRHLIHGRVFKGVLDADGNHHSAGRARKVPWVAIAPVVSAIRVLEQISPDGLLFDTAAHTVPRGRAPAGRTLHIQAMRARIEDFTAFASDLALRLNRPHETVPDDPHGAIGTARFRRSLACARSVSDQVAVRSAGVETRNLVSPLQLAGPAAA